jgi:GntR family transcriptional regulator
MAERTFRYNEIASAIRGDISSGLLSAESLLPSEADLSATHDASRVTVRRALDLLRDEGLITSQRGVGWFVAGPAVRQTLDALDTFEQQLHDEGRHSERRILDFGFVAPPERVGAVLPGDDVLQVSRLNLADGEPFAAVHVWCRSDVGGALSREDVGSSTFLDLLADRLGQASQTIGAVAADPTLAALLDVPEGSPLLRIWRVTLDTADLPLLVSEHHYPAHRTEFHVTLSSASSTGTEGLRLLQGDGPAATDDPRRAS